MGNGLNLLVPQSYNYIYVEGPKDLVGNLILSITDNNIYFTEKRGYATTYEVLIDQENNLRLTSNCDLKPQIGKIIVYKKDEERDVRQVAPDQPVLLVKWSTEEPANSSAVLINEKVSLAEFREKLQDAIKSWGKLNTFSKESSEKLHSRLTELKGITKKKERTRWHDSVISELGERDKGVFLRLSNLDPVRYEYHNYSTNLFNSLSLTQSYIYPAPKELGTRLTIRNEKFPDLFESIKLFKDVDLSNHIPDMKDKYLRLNGTSLSERDFMAIYIYTLAEGNVFKVLNDHMTHTRNQNLHKCRFYIAYLCEALKKISAIPRLTVYRGVSRNLVELYPSIYQVGLRKNFYSFTSTSTNMGTGIEFATQNDPDNDTGKGTLMIFEETVEGRDVKEYSAFEEAEILFPPGVSFKIMEINEKPSFYEIRMKQVQNEENLLDGYFE